MKHKQLISKIKEALSVKNFVTLMEEEAKLLLNLLYQSNVSEAKDEPKADPITVEALKQRGFENDLHYLAFTIKADVLEIYVDTENSNRVYIATESDDFYLPHIKTLSQLDNLIKALKPSE